MRDRADHLAWCKQRALVYLDADNLRDAVSSMMSDLSKHDDTANLILDYSVLTRALLDCDGPTVRHWIETLT